MLTLHLLLLLGVGVAQIHHTIIFGIEFVLHLGPPAHQLRELVLTHLHLLGELINLGPVTAPHLLQVGLNLTH